MEDSLANIGKITTFTGVLLFDALVRRFPSALKTRLVPSKSMFNAENFVCSLSLSIRVFLKNESVRNLLANLLLCYRGCK